MNNQIFKGKFGPLLIAEIGGNHEGDFDYAKQLTKLAINSKADVIKFQLYSGDSLVNKCESPERHRHFQKFELTKDQHLYLADLVVNSGKKYLASVWSKEMLSWIDPYLEYYKIGSGDLNAFPFIQQFALNNKPIILSTGLSTEAEVIESVKFIRDTNSCYLTDNLALLQCTSMYPIDYSDAHLNVMQRLKSITNAVVGYSDHTIGYRTLAYAAAMGAELLEFHFTDNPKEREFRDHQVSLTPDDIDLLVREIEFISNIKGDAEKQPLEIELKNNHHISFRRAVYPSRDIRIGEKLDENDLVVLRPLQGIDARDYYKLIGKKALKDIKKLGRLSWDLFD
jgi:N,N'-diacetyllegionaminate synthase